MEKILIVDDSKEERDLIASMLSSVARYELITADSGEEALRLLQTQRVDLLITDFVMPGLDGLQVANRAMEIDPSLRGRVLIVTGGMFGREDALAFALQTTVVTKPFTMDQFLKTVETLIAGQLPKGA